MHSPGDPEAAVIAHDEIGLPSQLLSRMIGHDLRVVAEYAGTRVGYERMKIVTIAIAAFIPATMGFFTCYRYVAPYFPSETTRIAASAISSALIFAIDCIVIRSLSSTGSVGMLLRLLLGVCLSITTADPLVNYFYSKSITAELTRQLNAESGQREEQIQAKLEQNEKEAEQINGSMANAEKELQAYSAENIAAQHLHDRAQHQNELAKLARARTQTRLNALESTKADLLKKREEYQAGIERKLVELAKEQGGQRDTGRRGKGDVYNHLNDEIAALRIEVQRLDDRTLSLDQQLQAASADPGEDANFGPDLAAPSATDVAIYELTAAEEAAKKRLQTQIARYQSQLEGLQARHEELSAERGHLKQDFAVGNRDDMLAQSKALWKVLQTDDLLRWKALAFFLLLYLADSLPIMVKLGLSQNYDSYVRTQEVERLAKDAARRDAAHEMILRVEANSMARLNRQLEANMNFLRANRPRPEDSHHIKAMCEEQARAMRDQQSYSLWQTRKMRVGDYRHASPARAIVMAFRTFMWFLRSKLMGGTH